MTPTLPSRDEIKADTPLRLSVAAALAFPDGSMTASGLRRECARGRFVVERIAGKQFTTLTHIEEMRRLCRVLSKELASTSEPNAAMWSETSPTTPPGSSAISSQMAQTSLRSLMPRLPKSSVCSTQDHENLSASAPQEVFDALAYS